MRKETDRLSPQYFCWQFVNFFVPVPACRSCRFAKFAHTGLLCCIPEFTIVLKRKKHKDINLKRINHHTIRFNNREKRAIDEFCKKHRIRNKSRFMRESILETVLSDYPTLFEMEGENTLFSEGRVPVH